MVSNMRLTSSQKSRFVGSIWLELADEAAGVCKLIYLGWINFPAQAAHPPEARLAPPLSRCLHVPPFSASEGENDKKIKNEWRKIQKTTIQESFSRAARRNSWCQRLKQTTGR